MRSGGGNTLTILEELGVSLLADNSSAGDDACVELSWPDELCSVLFKGEKNDLQRKKFSVQSLVNLFKTLNDKQEEIDQLPESEVAAIEEWRLSAMQAVYNKLEENLERVPTVEREEDDGSKVYHWFKKYFPRLRIALFGLLFILGLILDVLYNFSGFYEILQLAAFISAPVIIGVCLFLTAFNLILYTAFEGSMLAEMFDIRLKADEKRKLDAWDKQIDLTINIRKLLSNDDFKEVLANKNYQDYKNFVDCCDNTNKHRQDTFHDCQETGAGKWGRRILTLAGALLTIGTASFGAMSLLPVLCKVACFAVLFANPIGAGIFVGIVTAIMFVSYFAMQGRGIASLLSPNLAQKQEIRKKLDDPALVPKLKIQSIKLQQDRPSTIRDNRDDAHAKQSWVPTLSYAPGFIGL